MPDRTHHAVSTPALARASHAAIGYTALIPDATPPQSQVDSGKQPERQLNNRRARSVMT
jgi:hypothetical protein